MRRKCAPRGVGRAFASQLAAVDLNQACSRCSKRNLQMISYLAPFPVRFLIERGLGLNAPGLVSFSGYGSSSLPWSRPCKMLTRFGGKAINSARGRKEPFRASATRSFAKNILPVIRDIQSSGVTSHRAIARTLNARGVTTARGGQWTAVQVGAILQRVQSG
jgi:hypothetical protein